MATITGSNSGDILTGTGDPDVITALGGDDTVNALAGNDTVFGGDARDTLRGGDNDDTLFGEGDKDILFGDAGNDILVGGANQDRLNGGAGNDTFVYLDAGDSTITQQDVIQDFTQGQDRIDLSALLGATDLAWGGTTPTPNGVWFQQTGGGTTIVYVDLNGNTTADFRIQVNGLVTFTQADFLGVVQPGGGSGPVAVGDDAAASEDTVLNAAGNVLANDSGTGLSVTAVRFGATGGTLGTALAGAYGSVTLNSDGSYSYDLDNAAANVQALAQGQTVQDVFTYTVTNAGGSVEATLTVTITGSNDTASISGTSSGAVTEDATTTATGTLNASDVDTGEAQFQPQSNTSGTYGTFSITAGGGWTYVLNNGAANVQGLNAGQSVTDTFTVLSQDGTASQVVTITINGADEGGSNIITGTNAGQIINGTAGADTIFALGGNDIVNALGGADTVYGGDARDILRGGSEDDTLFGEGDKDQLFGDAGNDTLIGGAGQDRLTGGAGNDTFVYLTASDSTIAQQDVILDFTQGQDRIDLSALLGAVDLAWGGNTPTPNGVWFQQSGGNTIVYVDLTGNTTADFRIQVNGLITFTQADFLGVVQPGGGGTPPVPTDDVAAASEDGLLAANGNVLTNDAGAGLGVTAVRFGATVGTVGSALQGTFGSLTLNADGTYSYALSNSAANVQGLAASAIVQDVFTYTVSNADGDVEATLTVTITGANDAPTITATVTASTDEDTAVGGTATGNDVDTNAALTYSATNGTNGTVSIDANSGAWTYTPAANFNGGDSFTITVSDGLGGSAQQTVNVTVDAVNDAPTASDTTVATSEDTALNGNLPAATDLDNDSVTYALGTGAANGIAVVNGDGSFSYTPNTDFNGADSFTYSVSDGNGGSNTYTVTVNVGDANDPATITGDDTGAVTEDGTLTASGTLTVTDPDAGESFAQPQTDTAGTYGTFSVNAAGEWSYALTNAAANVQALANGATVTDTFTVTSQDGSESQNVVITITGANDAAVIGTTTSLTFFSASDATHGAELWVTDGTSAGTVLVKDIFVGSGSSSPRGFTALGDGRFLFLAVDETNGQELWVTDGTTAGTELLKDIFTGPVGSSAGGFTALGDGRFVFGAQDAAARFELWVTDGTSAGTLLLKDIAPGVNSSFAGGFVSLGDGRVLFTAENAASGRELWVTDGTSDGTVRLKDIYAGPASSDPQRFAALGDGRFVFTADDGASGVELWVTDGTSAGTALLKDIVVGIDGSNPGGFATLGDGRLLFSAIDPTIGQELWITDGTSAGTVLLKDIFAGSESSGPQGFASLGDGRFVFSANDGAGGFEVWVTDGTSDGTVPLKDIVAGSNSSGPHGFTAMGDGRVLFTAWTATEGSELWVTDGTSAGTVLLKDVFAGPSDSSIQGLTALGDGRFLFSANDADNGQELWVTDGTSAGTMLLRDVFEGVNASPSSNLSGLTPIGAGRFLFRASDGTNGLELWVTDGSSTGTALLKDILAGPIGSAPAGFTSLGNGRFLFTAQDATNGQELWVTDGTSAGTVLLKDIFAGEQGSFPDEFTALSDGRVLFTAQDAANGRELWVTDGTSAGTALLKDIVAGTSSSVPTGFTSLDDGRFLFLAIDETNGQELWVTDGTSTGTVLLKDIFVGSGNSAPQEFTALGDGRFLFSAQDATNGQELWVTDGTSAGTVLLKDIFAGANDSRPTGFTGLGDGRFLFAARDATNGRELWVTDGTTAGTVLLKNIFVGAGDSSPSQFTALGDGRFLFNAVDETNGRELWVTDGTSAGTVLLKDIFAGAGASEAQGFTALGDGRLLFSARDATSGIELWVTDGTAAGTVLLKDIYAGPNNSGPTGFTALSDGRVLFTARDAANGQELWVTDGTAAGTVLLKDIYAGPFNSTPTGFTALGDGRVLFTAVDATNGRELWVTDGTSDGTVLVANIASVPASSNPVSITTLDRLPTVTESGGTANDTQTGSNATGGVVSIEDPDAGEALFQLPANLEGTYGTFTFTAAGTWTYTLDPARSDSLDAGEVAFDTLTVTSADGSANRSIVVRVLGANDAPTATDTTVATNEDAVLNGNLPAATDVDNDTVTYALGTGAANGIAVVNGDGSFSYTPNTDFNGADSFTYSVSDGNGGSNTYTVTVNVGDANDPATITGDDTGAVTEDGTLTASGTLTVTDPDAGESFAQPQTNTAGTYGTFNVNAAGEWSYALDNDAANVQALTDGATVTDTFTVTSQDGSESQNVVITVTGANDAPTITATVTASTDEDNAVGGTATGSDVDTGAVLTYSATNGANGTVSIDANSGAWTYTPAANFNGGDSFTITVSDGLGGSAQQTVNVTVDAVNDAPTASDTTVATNEDTALNGNLPVASDLDNDTVTYALGTGAANGIAVVNGDGSFSYTPNTDFNGADSFTYSVSDGNGGSNTYTVTVNVGDANDPATITGDDTGNVAEDGTLTASGTVTVTDPDAGESAAQPQTDTAGTYGTFSVNAAGEWNYALTNAAANVQALADGATVTDTFTVTSADGSTSEDVVITITGDNDSPTIVATVNATTDEDEAVGGTAVGNDVDAGAVLGYSATNGANGTVSIDANSGAWTYTPAANFNGGDSFTITVSDGLGGSAQQTVNVTIDPVNDAPTASDTTVATNEDTALNGNLPAATDVDNDSVTYALGAGATNGTAAVNTDGSFSYTPNTDFNGTDSFTYTVSDSNGGSNTYTVTVNVAPVADGPVANTDTASLVEDSGPQSVTGNVLANDNVNDGGALSVVAPGTYSGNYGSLTIAADGSYTYTLDARAQAIPGGTQVTDSFNYHAANGAGTATGALNVSITGSNDAAVIGTTEHGLTLFMAYDTDHGYELWSTDGTTTGTVLLKDIQPGPGGSLPNQFTDLGDGRFLFAADDGTNGSELWITDGTAAGTTLLKDIWAGPNGSSPFGFTALGDGRFLFTAYEDTNGQELWVTDGTAAGTSLLKDIWSGAGNSVPDGFTALGDGRVLFTAQDATNGRELWVTDGTAAGTTLLKDIFAGSNSSSPFGFFALGNGRFLFTAQDESNGPELWVTDGTAAGTSLLKDIYVGPNSSSPFGFTALGDGRFLFTAQDETNGQELWVTDGTAAGTSLLKDIYVGPNSSSPFGFTALGDGRFLFTAQDETNGQELWVTDGTAAGTSLLKDIFVGPNSSSPFGFTALGDGRFLFSAFDPDGGYELWVTDGTAAGTELLKDIFSQPLSSGAGGFFALGDGRLLFGADNGTSGYELWVTDGTLAGTALLADLDAGPGSSFPGSFIPAGGGRFLFIATDSTNGQELWVTDGTTAGTTLLRDILPGAGSGSPTELTPLGDGRFIFRALDDLNGYELWVTDGTPAGTSLVKDIATGTDDSIAQQFVSLGDGRAIFTARDAAHGLELWITDGTSAGTTLVSDIFPGTEGSFPNGFTAIGDGRFLFMAQDATNNMELWITDGTAAGTALLSEIFAGPNGSFPSQFTALGDGRFLFTAQNGPNGRELWVTDGTPAGTTLLADIFAGPDGSVIGSLTPIGDGRFLFAASDATHNHELWVTDGTAAGTSLVKDINTGIGASSPGDFIDLGDGRFLFTASDATHGRELWVTDGTSDGTTLFADLFAGSGDSAPYGFTSMGDGRFLFAAQSSTNNYELWVTDGTTAGTALVKDIFVGPDGSYPSGFTALGDGRFVFTATDAAHGTEFWITDGTTAGTQLFLDIQPGANTTGGSSPTGFTSIGNGLFVFAAGESATGYELWITDGSAAGTMLLQDIAAGTASSNPNSFLSRIVVPIVAEAGGVDNATQNGLNSVSGTLPVADADSGEASFQVPANLEGTYGTFTFNTAGQWTYTLDPARSDSLRAGQSVFDSLPVTSADGSASSFVIVRVNGTNDVPTIAASATASTDEDQAVNGTATGSDVDTGAVLTYGSTNGAHGSVAINPTSGAWTYNPAANYNGTDSFTITVSDGQGGSAQQTVTVNIAALNDAPTAGDTTVSTNEDETLNGSLPAATDVDNDSITYALGTGATNGTATVNPDGSYSYAPNTDFNGADSFTYTVSDGNGGENTYTVTVNVGDANDPATITGDDTGAVAEDGTLTASGTLTVSDPDAGESFAQPQTDTAGTYGTFSVNAAGEWSYALDNDAANVQALANGEVVTDTFTVTSQDGSALRDVVITIAGRGDSAPELSSAETAFGTTDGVVTTNVATGFSSATSTSVAVQPDGKLVVAGWLYNADTSTQRFAVVRYQPDGRVDESFGADGLVTVDFGPGTNSGNAHQIVIDSFGRIVVVGNLTASTSGSDIALARILSDGSLDTSFGGGSGTVVTPIGPGAAFDIAHNVALQSDGKMVVVGWGQVGGFDMAVARYNVDGTLDSSFGGGDGIVTTPFISGSDDFGQAIVQQTDGKLVIAGNVRLGSFDIGLARFNTDGSLDTTFGVGGIVVTGVAPSNGPDTVNSMIQQADGKLVVVGSSLVTGNGGDLLIARYNSDGSLDSSFGGDGVVVVPVGEAASGDSGHDVIQLSDGRLLIATSVFASPALNEISLVRINADGTFDGTFGGGDGIATLAIPPTVNAGPNLKMVAQEDGKIVVTSNGSSIDGGDFFLARINADGSMDSTFGDPGFPDTVITEGSPFSLSVPSNLFVDPDGDAVTYSATLADGGSLPTWISFDSSLRQFSGSAPANSANIVIRITAADPSGRLTSDDFHLITNTAPRLTNGVRVDVGGSDSGRAVVLQPDGGVVLGGFTSAGPSSDFALASLTSDGGLRSTFGGGSGIVTTSIGSGTTVDIALALAAMPSGGVVLAGSTGTGAASDFALARYDANGALDTSFGGGDGVVTTDFGSSSDSATAVIEQSDGRLVVAGYTLNGPTTGIAVARYNTDGSLDASFGGGDGVATQTIGTTYSAAQSVLQQFDGKLVVTGNAYVDGSGYDFALLRFNPDGTLDASFGGGDGVVTTAVGGAFSFDFTNAAIQQSDGRLVLAGQSGSGASQDFALVRYNADGTLDTSFGGDGLVTTPILPNGSIDTAYGLTQQTDGKLVAVGSFNPAPNGVPSTNGNIAIVRYNIDGTLDANFGNGGIVSLAASFISSVNEIAYGVVQQPDGRLIVAGTSGGNFFSIRLNADGSVDRTFSVLHVPSAIPGTLFSFQIPADLFFDDGQMFYTVVQTSGAPLPPWLTFDATTRTLTGVAPAESPDLALRISATDIYGQTATVDVILRVPDPAQIGGDGAGTVTEDGALTASGTLTVTDPDAGESFAQPQTDTAGTYGTFSVNAAGEWTYTLDNDAANVQALANGATVTDTFTVTSQDGSESQNVVITITGANDAPTITATVTASTDEDTAVGGTATGNDVDTGATLSYSATNGANGTVSIDANSGAWTYTPAANFNGGDSFTITVSDGLGGSAQQTVNVTVDAVNDAPTASDTTVATSEDTVLNGNLPAATDLDNDTVTYALGTGAANGTAVVNGDGSFSYTPDTDFNGADSFTYSVSDGNGGSNTYTVTVNVGDANDPATITGDDTGAVAEDGTLTASGTLTVTDPDAGESFAQPQTDTAGTYGTFSVNAAGEWSYALTNDAANVQALTDGEIVTDTFTVTSQDGGTSQDVVITITGAADGTAPPVLTPAAQVFGSTSGIARADLSANDTSSDLLVQPDGKIVVAGYALNQFALARFNADGTLDAGFGDGGKVVTPNTGDISGAIAQAVERQPDGKLLLAGAAVVNGVYQLTLLRYEADGALDSTFGDGDGIAVAALPGGVNATGEASIVVQPDGKAIVLTMLSSGEFGIVRFNEDGSLDTDFGVDGVVTTDLGGSTIAYGIAQQADGKLVVAGYGGSGYFAVARFNEDGTPDSAFGTDGLQTTDVAGNGYGDIAYSLTIQADDKIVLAGQGGFATPEGFSDPRIALVRYNPDGSLDLEATTNIPGASFDEARSIIQQADGKLVVAGYAYTSTGLSDFVLVRYNADLTLDTSFGSGGIVVTNFGPGASTENAFSVVQQADGRLLVTGYASGSGAAGPDFVVVRYNSDGTLDTTFGDGGMPDISAAPDFTVSIPENLFTDPEGGNVTYDVTTPSGAPLPAWLEYDAPTRTLSSVVPGDAVDIDLRIVATDGDGMTAFDDFRVDINQPATITGDTTGQVTEGFTSFGSPFTFGNLVVTDADSGEAALIGPLNLNGQYGSLYVGTGGEWSYSLSDNSAAVQALPEFETVTDTFTVASYDGTAQQDIEITVYGSNDTPTIDPFLYAFTEEDAPLQGMILASDIDNGTTLQYSTGFPPIPFGPESSSAYGGHVSVDVQFGVWTYTPAANFFGTDSFYLFVNDGSFSIDPSNSSVAWQQVYVDVSPVEDPSVISGDVSGTVFEDGVLSANGLLIVEDPDYFSSGTSAQSSVQGAYGTFSVDFGGAWTYNLDNDAVYVQALTGTDIVTDTFTVYSLDGTAQVDVVVTINGANEPGELSGRVTDGPIAGASVYVDNNADGLVDGGDLLVAVTNASGGFTYDTADNPGSLGLVAVGGIDVGTGEANTIVLAAPAGFAQINPITSLIEQVMSARALSETQAEQLVIDAFGLPALDYATTDIYATSLDAQKIAAILGTAAALTAEEGVSGDPFAYLETQLTGGVGAGLQDIADAIATDAPQSSATFNSTVGGILAASSTTEIGQAQNDHYFNDAPTLTPAVQVFGITDGVATTNIGPGASDDLPFRILVQPDGKLVAAGSVTERAGAPNAFALVRYNPDGTLDDDFGAGGIVTTPIGSAGDFNEAKDLALQSDGKLIAAGQARMGATRYDFALARYNTDGTLDASFGGGDGIVTTAIGPGTAFDQGWSLVIQPDDRIVVAGQAATTTGGTDFAIVRYNADGTLDATFGGGDGIVTTAIGSGTNPDQAFSFVRQSDGAFVVAGSSITTSGGVDFTLARYDADGVLDPNFGSGGIVTTNFGSGTDAESARYLLQQSDGKLVAAGVALSATFTSDFALARYNSDGTLDTSFGGDGIVTVDVAVGVNSDAAMQVVEQADGKLVVVGRTSSPEGDDDLALLRFNSDGTLDTDFGGDGVVTVNFGPGASFEGGWSVALQPDGQIVVAGHHASDELIDDFAILRFNADGTLDTTFGDGGMQDQAVLEQEPFALTVPLNLFTDPEGHSLTYSASMSDGSALPAWMSFDPATRVLSGTPPAAAANLLIRITATDSQGASSSDLFRLLTTSADETFTAEPGPESFTGGPGNDTFVFAGDFGADIITDFTSNEDSIDLAAMTSPDWTTFADVEANMTQSGADTVIDLGNGNTITLVGVTAGNLTAGDFVL